MKLNARQTEAVNREKNVVVTAGAGSGKTSVLAMRYLRLIREGKAGVDGILTLTFTRKAAAEMYERIHGLLMAEKENETVRKELANFENAQISTIDSFCSRIVRNDPARFGMPGTFTQDTDEAAQFAEKEALDFLLKKQDDPALRSYVLRFGFERVWKGLFASLADEYFSLAEEVDFEAMAALQRNVLNSALEKDVAALERLVGECLDLGDTGFKTVERTQREFLEVPALFRDLISGERYDELAERSGAAKVKKPGGRSTSDIMEAYKGIVTGMSGILDDIVLAAKTLAGWDNILRMFRLCEEFQEVFLRRKRESGLLTFRDVSAMALDVLLHNHEVRRYYKDTFRYIMIDEFQDNNRLQKNLLYLLAEKRDLSLSRIPAADELEEDKLFFVGDQKQSIYRFRGADVTVIKELAGELGGGETGGITLSTNYRSEPGLIDIFNGLFRNVMDNPSAPYEAEFSPLDSRESRLAPDAGISLFYRPYLTDTDPGALHADDAEAYTIASYIRDTVKNGDLQVTGGGGSRPAGYGDFALLMRSTSNQIRYERMFRTLGVPYVTQDVRALFLEAPVNDIYSALESAVYPEDRLAFAAFLRSPFVNLSDEGFARVLLEVDRAFEGEIVPGLSDDDARRYAVGAGIVDSLRSRADRTGIVDLLYYLWFDRGYRYVVLRKPAYHGYLEYFEYLREYAAIADRKGMSTAAFLDQIRSRLGNYEKIPELTIPRGGVKGVQILTIHKSKGLEFPVVIVANMGNAGRSGPDTERPYYLCEEHGIAFDVSGGNGGGSLNYFYSIAREEEKARDIAELKRLLYVAATRAECHLVFSGCHNRNNRTRDDVLLNMLIRAAAVDTDEGVSTLPEFSRLSVRNIGEVTEEDLRNSAVHTRGVSLSRAAEEYSGAGIREYSRSRDEWTATELNEIYVAGRPVEMGKFLSSLPCDPILAGQNLEVDFGTYCHGCIEYGLRGVGGGPEVPEALAALPAADRETVERDARKLADAFLQDPFLSELPSGTRFYSERRLFYRFRRAGGSLYIHAQPDLFIERDDTNVIVDFKSDRTLEEHRYAMQLALYCRAAEGLNGKKTEGYLFFLRGGCFVPGGLDDGVVQDFLGSLGKEGDQRD